MFEAGWKPETDDDPAQAAAETGKHLQTHLKAILRDLKAHPDAWPFQKPVSIEVGCKKERGEEGEGRRLHWAR